MPALFAPALDLAALMAVLVALALVFLAYKVSQSVAGVLNFSILGVHPLSNVAKALENSIVSWLSSAVNELETVARDLFHGLTWMWGEFLDGINAMTTHTEQAFNLLWGTSVPAYINAAVRPFISAVNAVSASAEATARLVAREVNRLDAKIENTASATAKTLQRDITSAVKQEAVSIDAEIRAIRSSIDQAIDHALQLARAEGRTAIDELRGVENAAIGAIRAAEGATADELHGLIGSLNPAEIAGIVAAVPLLAQLVQTITAESGLDNAACRSKVKGICGTDPSDWGWLLAGAGAIGFGLTLAEIIGAGREVATYVMEGAEDLAELG